MTDTTLKKEARLCGTRQQLSPAKGQIATGEPIPICKKDEKILARVNRELSDAVSTIDQIENEIADGDRHHYAGNMRLLLRCLRRISKLPKGISATLKRAKALEAAR